MKKSPSFDNPADAASEIDTKIRSLPKRNTPNMRAVRRKYSRIFRKGSPEFTLEAARLLLKEYSHRWLAYELIANHKEAFQLIRTPELEEFGQGIDSWWSVDGGARILSGPAWLNGQAPDRLILTWAQSADRWWRRAALVSTVALNMRSYGGNGDTVRTLEVCSLLVADHDYMVVKAMSWALRELVIHDAEAVDKFLTEHEAVLAARVKREVKNKLDTGLKYPKGKSS